MTHVIEGEVYVSEKQPWSRLKIHAVNGDNTAAIQQMCYFQREYSIDNMMESYHVEVVQVDTWRLMAFLHQHRYRIASRNEPAPVLDERPYMTVLTSDIECTGQWEPK